MSRGNTIYEYYEKISERYYLARIMGPSKVQHLWQPLAKAVHIRGGRWEYDDYDFFMYKEDGQLVLCEALTGAIIIRQTDLPTRTLRRGNAGQFCTSLPSELDKLGGRSAINQLIINFLAEHDNIISPRYKATDI